MDDILHNINIAYSYSELSKSITLGIKVSFQDKSGKPVFDYALGKEIFEAYLNEKHAASDEEKIRIYKYYILFLESHQKQEEVENQQNKIKDLIVSSEKHIISLSLYPAVNDEAFESIITGKTDQFSEADKYTLEKLNLEDCRLLSDAAIKVLTENCPRLRELNLSGCTCITEQGVRSFLRNPQLKLKQLVLDRYPGLSADLVRACYDKGISLSAKEYDCQFLTLQGHSDAVLALTQLRNGRLVSASKDRTLKVWDLAKGKVLKTFEGHTDSVSFCKQLRDGSILSSSWDKALRIWDIDIESNASCKRVLDGGAEGHTDLITSCLQLVDGRLVSGAKDKTLKIWDIDSGECITTLEGHSEEINCLAQLSNSYVVSGSKDKTLKIWDMDSGECITTLEGHSDAITHCIQLEDDYLISSSHDGLLKVWNINTEQDLYTTVTTLRENTKNFVIHFVQLKEGYLICYLSDYSLEIWDIRDVGKMNKIKALSSLEENIQDSSQIDINTCCIVLENNCLSSTTKEGNIQLWFVGDMKA